jgi:N-acetylneuraminic acid mutarotase
MRRKLQLLSLGLLAQACATSAAPPAALPASASAPAELPKAANLPTTPAPPPAHATIVGAFDTPVTSFGATLLSHHVYTLGGYTGTPHEYVREEQSEAFSRYDLTNGTWESLASPGKSQSATLNSYQGRVVRVGGMRIENAKGAPTRLTSLDTVEFFEPKSGVWTKATPLPEARSSHATALVGSQLYVIGGWALDGAMDSASWPDSMLVTDLSRPTLAWKRIPMPFKSRALGAATLGRFIVTVGGMEGRRVQRLVHVYDTIEGTWAKGPDLPEPGFGVAVVSDEDRVYSSAASGTVYVLNPALDRWDVHGETIFPRFFHAAVATEEHRLLLLGGIPSNQAADRLRHIEQLSSVPTMFTSWLLDNPTGAKNRQGAFLLGNQLITFGGNKALGQHDFARENFLQVSYDLDLGSFAWKPLSAYPRAGQSMQTLITAEGVGVALGGFGPQETALAARADAVHYDFDKDAWTTVAALPEARTQFGLTEHGGKLWMFGGMNFDDTKKGDAMFSYPMAVLERKADASTAFVESGIQIPRARRAFGGVLLGDNYYMFGGMATGFAPVQECDAFNFTSKQWSAVACPSRVRIGAEIVALDDKLYLIAGRSKPTPEGDLTEDSRVEVFDPKSNTWSVLVEKLPIEDTHQLRAFAFNNRILLYTAQRNDNQAQVVLFDPSAQPL